MMKTILIATTAVAITMAALVTLQLSSESVLTLELRRFYFDVYRAVGIGFLVAVLAAVVPQLLPEARDRFERFKASRLAYSEAKTSALYLPARISGLDFAEAVEALEDAHVKLHVAETYKDELVEHLSTWYPQPELWGEQTYWELTGLKRLMLSKVEEWSRLRSRVRLDLADQVVSEVKRRYSQPTFRSLNKVERENQLEAAIDHVASALLNEPPAATNG